MAPDPNKVETSTSHGQNEKAKSFMDSPNRVNTCY